MKSIIIQPPGHCALCDMHQLFLEHSYLEEHHIFGGTANRKQSEKYGLKVNLCLGHHRGNSQGNREAVHTNQENNLKLKILGQQSFEKTHTREEFIRVFGKSYL